jgi:hypothetical protein
LVDSLHIRMTRENMKRTPIALILAIALLFSQSGMAYAKGGHSSGGGSSHGGPSGSHSSSSHTSGSKSGHSSSKRSSHSGSSHSHASASHKSKSSVYSSSGTHSGGRQKAAGVKRDKHGRIERSTKAKDNFRKDHPCPSTGKTTGACPGYVIDHIKPLKEGGADSPGNMQWQTVQDAKAKDKWE